jgi:ketosteroid isomerase-like protein
MKTLAILLFTLTLSVHAQTALTLNAPIAAELKANEKHSYQLTLNANQTAYIVIHQLGVDVQTNVFDAAGKMILEMDTPMGGRGKEAVWLTNQPAGVYRLELTPVTGADGRLTAGKYDIALVELRAAAAADSRRWQAQAAYLAARTSWRSSQATDRKAAVPRLEEAAGWLENDAAYELFPVVENRLLQLAPLAKIERMKLAKTPGLVTAYHSADLAQEAKSKVALLESMLNFYEPLLKTKPALNYVNLNKDDWKRFCPVCPYQMPWMLQPEPLVYVESNDLQATKGMLAMFKSKVPAAISSALAAQGLSYDTATPLILDAAGYLNLAGVLHNRAIAVAPNRGPNSPNFWMANVVMGYLVHAWLGEKHPALRQQIKLGLQLPGAVLTPASRTLSGMFSSTDMFTGGVALSRASDLGGDLYDKHKLSFLTELLKAFPKDQKLDAAAAEQRFIALSPLIKAWVESFGYSGAALAVQQAEHALVAARKAKDAAAFERLVATDYCGLNQFGQQRDFAGFRMSATQATPVAVFTLDRLDIELSGDLAIVRGAQTEQWQGGPLEHHLFTRIWVKRDGRWQLLSNTQFIDPNRK